MTDLISPERRSWNMSRIRSRDTKPELVVRSVLHRLGYRFRLHDARLPGKPDIVLPKHETVLFVHGCFWHRHRGCPFCYTPKSNRAFWNAKFKQNVVRDSKNKRKLKRLGWRILVIWECQTTDAGAMAERFENFFSSAV